MSPVGAMSGIVPSKWQVRAIAQLPMFASKIASSKLKKAVSSSRAIADLCLRYNEVLLAQARIGAACNALHHVEARFCRCLLQTRDRTESDTIMLTQAFLAQMLGVEVARKISTGLSNRAFASVLRFIRSEAGTPPLCMSPIGMGDDPLQHRRGQLGCVTVEDSELADHATADRIRRDLDRRVILVDRGDV